MGWTARCWSCGGTGKPGHVFVPVMVNGEEKSKLQRSTAVHLCETCGGSGIRFTPHLTNWKPSPPPTAEWWFFRQIERMCEIDKGGE